MDHAGGVIGAQNHAEELNVMIWALLVVLARLITCTTEEEAVLRTALSEINTEIGTLWTVLFGRFNIRRYAVVVLAAVATFPWIFHSRSGDAFGRSLMLLLSCRGAACAPEDARTLLWAQLSLGIYNLLGVATVCGAVIAVRYLYPAASAEAQARTPAAFCTSNAWNATNVVNMTNDMIGLVTADGSLSPAFVDMFAGVATAIRAHVPLLGKMCVLLLTPFHDMYNERPELVVLALTVMWMAYLGAVSKACLEIPAEARDRKTTCWQYIKGGARMYVGYLGLWCTGLIIGTTLLCTLPGDWGWAKDAALGVMVFLSLLFYPVAKNPWDTRKACGKIPTQLPCIPAAYTRLALLVPHLVAYVKTPAQLQEEVLNAQRLQDQQQHHQQQQAALAAQQLQHQQQLADQQQQHEQDLHDALEGQQQQHEQELHDALEGQQQQHEQELHDALDGQQQQHEQELHDALEGQQQQHEQVLQGLANQRQHDQQQHEGELQRVQDALEAERQRNSCFNICRAPPPH